jgi:hypothetical protein
MDGHAVIRDASIVTYKQKALVSAFAHEGWPVAHDVFFCQIPFERCNSHSPMLSLFNVI